MNAKAARIRIGVAMGGLPRMLGEIILTVLQSQPDFDVVVLDDPAPPTSWSLQRRRFDALVLSLSAADPETDKVRLLHRRPRLKLIGVCSDGRSASLWALRPTQRWLGELSADGLVSAIRAPLPVTPIVLPADLDERRGWRQ